MAKENAGHKNLIPANKRSKAEHRAIAQKGGIASGKTRQAKQQLKAPLFKTIFNQLLDSNVSNNKIKVGDREIPVKEYIKRAMPNLTEKEYEEITGKDRKSVV